MVGTWLGEICSCSCLAVLPDTAWVLLNKIYQPFFHFSVVPPKKGNQPERFVMAIDGAPYVAALGGLSPVARLPYPANKCFLEIPLLARLKFTTCFSFESVESCTITEQFRCMNHYKGTKQTVVIFGLCAYTLFRFRCY